MAEATEPPETAAEPISAEVYLDLWEESISLRFTRGPLVPFAFEDPAPE